jgi:hypothetical protein
MVKQELGRIIKENVTIIEYVSPTASDDDKVFIQVGVVGLFCNKKELKDLSTAINYFINMEEISSCEVIMNGE